MIRRAVMIGLGLAIVFFPGPFSVPVSADNHGWATPAIVATNQGSYFYSTPLVVFTPDPSAPMGTPARTVVVWNQMPEIWSAVWECEGIGFGCHWEPPTLVRGNLTGDLRLQFVADSNGGGFAVWNEKDGLWSSRLNPNNPNCCLWAPADLVGPGAPFDFQVAADSRGNALAAWSWGPNSSVGYNISASRFIRGQGWTAPTQIAGSSPAVAYLPYFAMKVGVDGNAIIAWSTETEVFARRYAGGWGPPARLYGYSATRGGCYVSGYRNAPGVHGEVVVRDTFQTRSGDAMVLWDDCFTNEVWQDHFDAIRNSWNAPTIIAENVSGLYPGDMDELGNSIVAWWGLGDTLGSEKLFARRYDAHLDAWGSTAAVFAPSPTTLLQRMGVRVQMGFGGNASVVFSYRNSTDVIREGPYQQIWANKFNLAKGSWGTPTQLTDTAYRYAVAGAPDGDMAIVWSRFYAKPGEDVVFRWFDRASDKWSRPLSTGTSDQADPWWLAWPNGQPSVAIDPYASRTLVLWSHSSGNRTNLLADWFYPDVTPPALTLRRPTEGLVTVVPAVMVSGITEPGSALIVNGVTTAVESNGSFSVSIALSMGANTITASATDEAGNVATSTVRVTFENSAVALEEQLQNANRTLADTRARLENQDARLTAMAQQTIFLTALLAPIAVGGAVSLILCLDLRRRFRPPGMEPNGRRDGSPGLTVFKPFRVRKVAPQPERKIDLTVKERILLHLMDYAKRGEQPEVPANLTQEGIAQAAWFDQRHFAQYVRPLVREGLLWEGLAHVDGLRQRRKVYRLTDAGTRRALRLRDKMRTIVVHVKDRTRVVDTTVSDLLAKAPEASLLAIARQAMESGSVNLGSLSGNRARRGSRVGKESERSGQETVRDV